MIQQQPRRWSTPSRIRLPRAGHAAAVAALAVLGGSMVLAGCNDTFQPTWTTFVDTAVLFTLARPELNLPTAFSFNGRRSYRVEAPGATGNWDIALDTEDGALVLLPPGALGISSRAGIAALPGVTFEAADEAPTDSTAYVTKDPVTVTLGSVYAVRTGEVPGSFGGTCVYYGKMEPLEMDVELGTLTFLYDSNPLCNDNRLIPPD